MHVSFSVSFPDFNTKVNIYNWEASLKERKKHASMFINTQVVQFCALFLNWFIFDLKNTSYRV